MIIRQQILLDEKEVHAILIAHFKTQGLRLKEDLTETRKDGSFFAVTMTEDEVYVEESILILQKPLSSLEVKDKKLKDKLLKKAAPDATIGSLLRLSISNNNQEVVIKNNSLLNEFDSKYGIDKEEHTALIDVFAGLGINLKY